MKKLQRLTLADLSSEFEVQVLSTAEQECVVGGGSGTASDPYSYEIRCSYRKIEVV